MRRYGYGSLKQLNTVVDSYAYAKIPLETFVTDSQYMLHDQDFTLGEEFPVGTFQVRTYTGNVITYLPGVCDNMVSWYRFLCPGRHVHPCKIWRFQEDWCRPCASTHTLCPAKCPPLGALDSAPESNRSLVLGG